MSDENDEMMDTVKGALRSLDTAYVHNEDGVRLPTTIITGPGGEIVAKWERGTKTPFEVEMIVRQFNEVRGLPESNRALSASEAATILGVTRRTILNWANAGRFPSAWTTVGGHLRIPESEVRALREGS